MIARSFKRPEWEDFSKTFFMFLGGVFYFFNILRINPWLAVQNLTGHKYTFQSLRHHFAGGPNTEKIIKSSVQALKQLWAEWSMLSEHTGRWFLGSWKKYFSGFSCICTQNIRKKSRTYRTCMFGCRIEVIYYWIIKITAS